MEPPRVTYRRTDDGWEALLSTGGQLPPEPDLVRARAAVHEHCGGAPGAETVKVPMEGHGVGWAGLRFELFPPLYGADAPTPEQNERLTECFEYYQARLPAGMRVECAGNRIRVDPVRSGLAAALLVALDAVNDDAHAQLPRAQLRQAMEIEVPAGFIRIAHDFVGLEEFGDVGHLHLVLRERWPADAPC